jgi:16S rRNA (uracil1498-N3)-methyltransferase
MRNIRQTSSNRIHTVPIHTNTTIKAPRHFVQMPLVCGQSVALPIETAHHIGRVTRMRTGDTVTLFNGDGFFYHGTLSFSGKNDCSVAVEIAEKANTESNVSITLMQGLASSEKMAWAIEKATELGAQRIVPVECHRSVAHINTDKTEKKQQHWLKIARAAAAQCGRATVPSIETAIGSCNHLHFEALHRDHEALLVLSPVGIKSISAWADGMRSTQPHNATRPSRLAIYIGPEGGLDEAEIAFALDHSFQAIRIGPRVLRTETAGPTAIAAIQALMGDF